MGIYQIFTKFGVFHRIFAFTQFFFTKFGFFHRIFELTQFFCFFSQNFVFVDPFFGFTKFSTFEDFLQNSPFPNVPLCHFYNSTQSRNFDDCKKYGKIENCSNSQDSCMVEIRKRGTEFIQEQFNFCFFFLLKIYFSFRIFKKTFFRNKNNISIKPPTVNIFVIFSQNLFFSFIFQQII